jgi:hypothetical protein
MEPSARLLIIDRVLAEQPSYLHGHSALSRASSRRSGGNGLQRGAP